jgi:hypothetical protein
MILCRPNLEEYGFFYIKEAGTLCSLRPEKSQFQKYLFFNFVV